MRNVGSEHCTIQTELLEIKVTNLTDHVKALLLPSTSITVLSPLSCDNFYSKCASFPCSVCVCMHAQVWHIHEQHKNYIVLFQHIVLYMCVYILTHMCMYIVYAPYTSVLYTYSSLPFFRGEYSKTSSGFPKPQY